MAYNAKAYWQDRSSRWSRAKRQQEHDNLVNFIRNRVPEDGTILDVGSGDGQIYLFLKEDLGDFLDGRYFMCDIVDGMREKCHEKTGIMPDKWDGVELPYESNSFDAIVSISVMLHVPFDDIKQFIKEHRRVTKEYIFVGTWYDGSDEKTTGPHCFHHRYHELFKWFDLEIVEEHETMRRGRKHIRRDWVLRKT
jgi:ubiquinone/menaquinone biosynthesis C-methylase UbiE